VTVTTASEELQIYEKSYVNFARIIYRYYRSFASSDPVEALQYIYLVCLNAQAPEPAGSQQVKKCHDYIRELVMETRAYAQLLGDVRNDGTKVPGQIERDLKLIRLKDEKDYLLSIVKVAAQRADQEKRFADTVLLYNLAEEYESVVRVLIAALGASLSQPSSSSRESAQAHDSITFGMQDDLVSSVKSILEHYERSAVILHRISKKARDTCNTLLKLKQVFNLYEENRLENALSILEDLNIVPLDGDLVTIIRRAEESKDLDEAILRNFDTLLLTVMNILYKIHSNLKESPYGDASRQQKMNDVRKKARALMMYAGMLRYRLSGDTYSHLTRLDVFLH
jgi:nuclear pore complex protein Nup93